MVGSEPAPLAPCTGLSTAEGLGAAEGRRLKEANASMEEGVFVSESAAVSGETRPIAVPVSELRQTRHVARIVLGRFTWYAIALSFPCC